MQSYLLEPKRRSAPVRFLRGFVVFAVAVALVGYAIGGWIVSSEIGDTILRPSAGESIPDGSVVAVAGDRITLRAEETADRDVGANGVFGFNTGISYLRLGEILSSVGSDITRTFEVMEGPKPEMGQLGDVDVNARPAELAANDLGFAPVTYRSPLGDMDAWLVEGSSMWLIYVHDPGKGLDQAQRLIAATAGEGFTHMAITYRNDPGQPADPSGIMRFGVAERDDLAAAVAFARDHGAEQVVVVGYGAGASIAMAEMYRDLGLTGAILDSPIIDGESAAKAYVERSPLGILPSAPPGVAEVGTVFASLRYGINWNSADYLKRSDQLIVPVLLLHGTDDERAPIEDSQALADRRPEQVTLVAVEGAGSDAVWNRDPAIYESAVLDFLDDVRSAD
ncbi:MAG: hypothetical protein OEW91_05705 [Acidimicrobiia bacterium]|nr:hypothetical protein [Acidimicrobiia bacterium]